MKKLKKRWNVTSNTQFLLIFVTFAITGYSSLMVAIPFLKLLGIDDTFTPYWLYRLLRIILIFPIYQILLVAIGAIFGQFAFFWNFEKKMLTRLKLGFIIAFLERLFIKKNSND
ncbi:MAG TPA: diacylglyceryl transferase [Flavobacterium sp.]|nr:diacylglyceryl transferase [Flavobacterium sp.]